MWGKKKVITISIMTLLFFVICFPIKCNAEQQVIRVGYMDYPGFIEEQSDGTYIGYAAEYLAKISEYTGFKYEYVYGDGMSLLEMLKNEEIDLFCSAQYTKERAEQYDYSSYPIGYTQGLLYTRKDNTRLGFEDFRLFDGMTVGIIQGNAMKELFLQYEKEHGFQSILKEYDTETEMLAALESGEIDSMCSEHLANHQGLSLLAKFGTDAYYFISYKNNPYISKIDYALQQIKTDVDYETDLFHKYYDSSTAATTLQFTLEEREFIESSKPFIVGLNRDRAPFSIYDEKTGTFSGICVDVLDQIAKKSGLTFQYVPQETGVKTADMLESGEYDFICGVERDNFVTSETITTTDAFLESPIVPVAKKGRTLDVESDLVAAIPSAFQALKKNLEMHYPHLQLVFYDSNRECLDAVKSGKADIFIQNTHILSLLLQEPKYENLAILPIEIMTEHTAIALPRSSKGFLVSVLNKSLSNIDAATISSSLINHTFAHPYRFTALDIMYKFRVQIIIITFLVMLCFALLIGFAIVRRRSEMKLQKQNELLVDAVAQADRANIAKSEFLSRMSHEIRTPMNAIVGFTKIIKNQELDAKKVNEYLSNIELSSKVLLNIINDVLDMSAIESNKLKIANTEFDMKKVLTGIYTIYYPQCQSKGINFEMNVNLENEILIGDSLRVNQILLNLVSNAYKFTDEGGTIKILAEESARKDNLAFLRMTISDTGCGMTQEMIERLFKPFEQENAETAKKYGGSGLGLSIAKNLVSLMQGAIRVESEKDKGTTFTVELPFEIGTYSTAEEAEVDQYDFSGYKVLLAEDQELNAEIAMELLDFVHLKADWVENGQKALERFQKEAPGTYVCILMDVQMPVMDGYEAAKAIRALERADAKQIPIYAMTANAFTEDVSAALSAGMDGHIPKPIDTKVLYSSIQKIIDL